jgi:hypothetical protein
VDAIGAERDPPERNGTEHDDRADGQHDQIGHLRVTSGEVEAEDQERKGPGHECSSGSGGDHRDGEGSGRDRGITAHRPAERGGDRSAHRDPLADRRTHLVHRCGGPERRAAEQGPEQVDAHHPLDQSDRHQGADDPPRQQAKLTEGRPERRTLRPDSDDHRDAEDTQREASAMLGAAEHGTGHTLSSAIARRK